MSWSGHFHGYGPWVGSPETYHRAGYRRPPHPSPPTLLTSTDDKKAIDIHTHYHQAAKEFPVSPLPPMMSGHWLLKRAQASPERTWASATAAVDWLTAGYLANLEAGHADPARTGAGLDGKRVYALDALPGGVDVSWVYYDHASQIVSIEVVCCPNLHHPELACPLTSRS